MKEIFLYGEIGKEVQARDVMEQFQAAAGEEVRLRIHSGGGSVFDGLAILGAMRAHDRPVTARIDGVAFSMAANLALEADRIEAHEDGWLMFHEASCGGAGLGEDDLKSRLAIVQELNRQTVVRLAGALGRFEFKVAEDLKAEMWDTASGWAAAGLAIDLLPAAALAAKFDPEGFQQLPAQLCVDCLAFSDSIQSMSDWKDAFAALGFRKTETATPDEVETTLADLRRELENLKAENELQTDALAFARGKIEQLTAEVTEARASSQEQAYQALAAVGHERVSVAGGGEAPTSVAEQYNQLSEDVKNGVPGAAAKRAEFRKRNKSALLSVK